MDSSDFEFLVEVREYRVVLLQGEVVCVLTFVGIVSNEEFIVQRLPLVLGMRITVRLMKDSAIISNIWNSTHNLHVHVVTCLANGVDLLQLVLYRLFGGCWLGQVLGCLWHNVLK